MGLGQASARPRCSPYLEADEEVATFPTGSGDRKRCTSVLLIATQSAQPPLPLPSAPRQVAGLDGRLQVLHLNLLWRISTA